MHTRELRCIFWKGSTVFSLPLLQSIVRSPWGWELPYKLAGILDVSWRVFEDLIQGVHAGQDANIFKVPYNYVNLKNTFLQGRLRKNFAF